MVGRKKQLSEDVDKLHFSLTTEEQLVLHVIRLRRKKRVAERSGQSQIVADALWKLLLEEEKVPREYITRLSDVEVTGEETKKIRKFPAKNNT